MSELTVIPCNGADYSEMASLLLAVAREIGLPTNVVRIVYNGFEVPKALLDAWDPQPIASRPADGDVITPELDNDAVAAPKRRGRPPKVTTEA